MTPELILPHDDVLPAFSARPVWCGRASTVIGDATIGARAWLGDHSVIRADGNGTLSEEFPVEARDVIIDLHSRQNPAWNYNTQKIRGVNIGGWLVAEPWITPDLFDNTGDNRVIDEYTFGQYVGNARSRLQAHWASFITENDFRLIASYGLNRESILSASAAA